MGGNSPAITRYGILSTLLLLLFMSDSYRPLLAQSPGVETGVSQALAKERKQILSRLSYALKFDIPAEKNQPIPALETITFSWQTNKAPLLLDFKEERTHLQNVSVNKANIPIVFDQEHLSIATTYLKPGTNTIDIRFTAGNLSLNRNEEYLYTLLVPTAPERFFPASTSPI